jgi:hydroxylamine reductase
MFCFQCQETAKNTGCTVKGVCGKPEEISYLQDLLIFILKGISVYGVVLKDLGEPDRSNDRFIAKALFSTITNVNWDKDYYLALIEEGLERKRNIRARLLSVFKDRNGREFDGTLPDAATWDTGDPGQYDKKAEKVGVLATEDEDVRSLRELLIIGLKGISAYSEHAAALAYQKDDIYDFLMEGLASTTRSIPQTR